MDTSFKHGRPLHFDNDYLTQAKNLTKIRSEERRVGKECRLQEI